MADLNKFKGQFVKGNPPKCQKPRQGNNVQYYDTIEIALSRVRYGGLKQNGWIPPRKGAL